MSWEFVALPGKSCSSNHLWEPREGSLRVTWSARWKTPNSRLERTWHPTVAPSIQASGVVADSRVVERVDGVDNHGVELKLWTGNRVQCVKLKSAGRRRVVVAQPTRDSVGRGYRWRGFGAGYSSISSKARIWTTIDYINKSHRDIYAGLHSPTRIANTCRMTELLEASKMAAGPRHGKNRRLRSIRFSCPSTIICPLSALPRMRDDDMPRHG